MILCEEDHEQIAYEGYSYRTQCPLCAEKKARATEAEEAEKEIARLKERIEELDIETEGT